MLPKGNALCKAPSPERVFCFEPCSVPAWPGGKKQSRSLKFSRSPPSRTSSPPAAAGGGVFPAAALQWGVRASNPRRRAASDPEPRMRVGNPGCAPGASPCTIPETISLRQGPPLGGGKSGPFPPKFPASPGSVLEPRKGGESSWWVPGSP